MSKGKTSVAWQIRDRMEKEGATKAEIDEVLKKYYKDVNESNEYIGSLMRDQYRGRYAPRSEKSSATMRILYDEDE